jgi:cysteine synthase A
LCLQPPLRLLVPGGVAFGEAEREGRRKKRQVDTLCEGIGLTGRLTRNMREAQLDVAFGCTDQECVDMARFILEHEGFFIGSSSAANLVGAVKAARRLPPGARVVTVLCDGGWRHLSKFWSEDFLRSQGLQIRTCTDLAFVEH